MITFALVVYFGLFATFASYMLFKADVSNLQKILLPALLFTSIAWAYLAIAHEKGYPTPVNVPDGDIAAIEIVNPTADDEGGIFLWVYPEDNDEEWKLDSFLFPNHNRRPKAYALAWTEERAKKYEQMKQAQKEGFIVQKKKKGDGDFKLGENIQDNNYNFIIIDPRVVNPKPS
jgi:hypothetical protein